MSSSSFSGSVSPSFSMSSCTCLSSRMTFCSLGTAARSSSLSVRSLTSSSTKPCESMAIFRSSWLFRIFPSSGKTSPVRTFSCVVFPQPLAPTSATLSPVLAHQEASCRMRRPPRRCSMPFRPTPTVPSMPPVSMLKAWVSESPRFLRMTITSSSSSSSLSEASDFFSSSDSGSSSSASSGNGLSAMAAALGLALTPVSLSSLAAFSFTSSRSASSLREAISSGRPCPA
mmetsp:Transcript_7590/g.16255  ORF Transcript_7590/g.16255 Transcript_7590/m.16255 type:complete len:229 (+) Transcript_7590:1687-2373(+)